MDGSDQALSVGPDAGEQTAQHGLAVRVELTV
jgi:hypothetical protein